MRPNADRNAPSPAKAALLVDAVLDGWQSRSSGELSARLLAIEAGIAPSAIYYYFTDLEHLYEAAQTHAIAEAERWCAVQRQTLAALGEGGPLAADALGPLLAALIDRLCDEARRSAFAWRECQLLAARQPRFEPLLAQWNQLFRDLCRALCRLVGLDHAADLTFLIFEGEGLFHLIRWDRLADRAALDEIATGWADWMQGRIPGPAPIRARLWAQARQATAAVRPARETLERIARASARLLVARGVSGITHRAVAAESGLTLGVVAHNCRRAADLLEQAYGALYQELTGNRLEQDMDRRPDPTLGMPSRGQMLGVEELALAVARGRTDAGFASRLRYLCGATGSRQIEQRLGIDSARAVLIATIIANSMIALLRNVPEDERQTTPQSIEARLFQLFANPERQSP